MLHFNYSYSKFFIIVFFQSSSSFSRQISYFPNQSSYAIAMVSLLASSVGHHVLIMSLFTITRIVFFIIQKECSRKEEQEGERI